MTGEAFEDSLTTDEWRQLYAMAVRQSLTGVCYQGVRLMPEDRRPPMDILVSWAAQAETVRGLNELQNTEAARLTQLFADNGRRTVILKGQANARLYPDKLSRQPGDIDIYVEGGPKSVLALLNSSPEEGELRKGLNDLKGSKMGYHHMHLPANERGVVVEIHFRPCSGNVNPLTNRRLQKWLEREIMPATMVEEGFCVPSVRFALVMQLAHVMGHFLDTGIGLRHITDYYWLLRTATAEERQAAADVLGKFGLRRMAGALMWVMGEVMHLEEQLMLCEPDGRLGEELLNDVMEDGDFGVHAGWKQLPRGKRFIKGKRRRLRLRKFAPTEVMCMEMKYWLNHLKIK